jgi:L-fuconolactonase
VIVDAYSHCGEIKHAPVERVLSTMKEVGISRTVLCQHLDEYDNTYLSNVVAQHPDLFTAVCLIDPNDPGAGKRLEEWQKTGRFRGVRVLAQWLPKNIDLWCAAMHLGLNLLIYAPDGIKASVHDISTLARSCPSQKIVISHLGNPKVENGRMIQGDELMALAGEPNVCVQLSGQAMFCEYPYTVLDPLVSDVVTRFGPGRIMWGSNFPVGGDSQKVSRDLALVRVGAWGLDRDGVDWVTRRTAMNVWFGASLTSSSQA